MTGTLDDLRTELGSYGNRSAEYIDKQVHRVPGAPVVVRETFILERCKGQVVLDIGASGPMHEAIVKIASCCYGIDREESPGVMGLNLDDYHAKLPYYPAVSLVVLGEIVEHLSNPGNLLDKLRANYKGVKTIVTVPNAFSDISRRHMETGVENVNRDHVAWYSHRTMKTLLERSGYEIKELAWYKGRAMFAEGLIIVTE